MPKKIDMSGRRFGRLSVLREEQARKGRRVMWHCQCDCGNQPIVDGSALRSGNTYSCGCARREVSAIKSFKHGGVGSSTYDVWESMKKRCFDPNQMSYPNYGGKGIHVCKRWMSFESFLADMGVRPDGMSIDRIDNTKGYEPGNCRWATPTEQQRNRTNNKILTLNGVRKTQSEWASELGLYDATIHKRLKRGWSVAKALSEGVSP